MATTSQARYCRCRMIWYNSFRCSILYSVSTTQSERVLHDNSSWSDRANQVRVQESPEIESWCSVLWEVPRVWCEGFYRDSWGAFTILLKRPNCWDSQPNRSIPHSGNSWTTQRLIVMVRTNFIKAVLEGCGFFFTLSFYRRVIVFLSNSPHTTSPFCLQE